MGPWEQTIKEDVLYNKSNQGGQDIDIKKIVSYIVSIQSEKGYFDKPSPGIENTWFCTGILHTLGEKPSGKTIEYIKSLQVGNWGFAQTTGEMPWIDKSYLALQMYQWFDVEVQNRAQLIKFFQQFQNKDGGFGSIMDSMSSPQTTIHTLHALEYLAALPFEQKAAIEYLKRMECNSLWEHYHKAICLQALGSQPLDFNKIFKPEDLDIWDKYYYLALRKKMGWDTQIEQIYAKEKDNFHLARLANLSGYKRLNAKLLDFVNSKELPQGGYPWEPQGIISNGFVIQSMLLLDGLDVINKDAFVKWLLSVKGRDGWGSRPGDDEYHEYTVAALIALRLLDRDCDKVQIIKKAIADMDHALDYQLDNNYYVLRTIKNSLEKMMLCNTKPPVYKIPKKVMKYYREGGFGSKVPYVYATYWAVRALYLCENYMKFSGNIFLSRISKIKHKTTKWINSCQNTDGGFGPGPGVPSNIQSTYCAVYSLWMLGAKPKDVRMAITWIKSLQAKDGGFAGHPGMKSEMLHILYAVGSLAILADMK